MSNKVQVIFTFELVNRERKEVQGGAPIKLSSIFMMPQGYKKYRHASWRTGRRSVSLPGR